MSGADGDTPLFFSKTQTMPELTGMHVDARGEAADEGAWRRRYLGTFVLCAYSMTKGSDCLRAGERVLILRKSKTAPRVRSSKHSRVRTKDRADYVVRFSNLRGALKALAAANS